MIWILTQINLQLGFPGNLYSSVFLDMERVFTWMANSFQVQKIPEETAERCQPQLLSDHVNHKVERSRQHTIATLTVSVMQ